MASFETYRVKIVPDDAPNTDGQWTTLAVPTGMNPFLVIPARGYHVVYARLIARGRCNVAAARANLQDGGPMHARFLRGGQL